MPPQCNESVVSQRELVVQTTERSAAVGTAIKGKSYIEAHVSMNCEIG